MTNKNEWDGICSCCFAPVFLGDGIKFRKTGRVFHKNCINKNTYYEKLEKRLAAKERKKEVNKVGLQTPLIPLY